MAIDVLWCRTAILKPYFIAYHFVFGVKQHEFGFACIQCESVYMKPFAKLMKIIVRDNFKLLKVPPRKEYIGIISIQNDVPC